MSAENRYKVILVEDGTTILGGFTNAITAATTVKNHPHHKFLGGKEWKVVRDLEAESLLEASKQAVAKNTKKGKDSGRD